MLFEYACLLNLRTHNVMAIDALPSIFKITLSIIMMIDGLNSYLIIFVKYSLLVFLLYIYDSYNCVQLGIGNFGYMWLLNVYGFSTDSLSLYIFCYVSSLLDIISIQFQLLFINPKLSNHECTCTCSCTLLTITQYNIDFNSYLVIDTHHH